LTNVPPARVTLWVLSIGGLALAARALFVGPVPLWVALLAMTAYVAFCIGGALVPRLEMFGDVTWHGDTKSGGVALTFDDGPNPVTTRRILALLAEADARATFFVLGEKVEQHPDVLKELVLAGHSIGVHGYRHDRLYAFNSPVAVAEDIERVQTVIERAAGARARWFRPPVGQVSPRTAEGAKRAGVDIIGWSVRGLDGLRGADPGRVATRIERGLESGAIVLLHDAAERDDFAPASLEALPKVLESIARKGLRVVPLQTLIEDERSNNC
jgi:peptidoglycan/xylan/chitin deacetylase (PgdA/CDA1 family)